MKIVNDPGIDRITWPERANVDIRTGELGREESVAHGE